MGFDVLSFAAAKTYTDKEIEGGGAVQGKNCTIDSIVPITGGNRVTFKWYLDDGTEQTETLDVMDGEDGPQGPQGIQGVTGTGIDSVSVDENNNLTVTYDDGTSELAGQIQLNGDQGYIPCGTRLGYYGTTAPLGFLLCDGTEYLKSDYPQLAELLGATDSTQGTTVFAGSDSDHFKVPDLRGEFIRGAGTNSHTNQGSGANVGVHQDGTEIPYTRLFENLNILQLRKPVSNADVINTETTNYYNYETNNTGTDSGQSSFTSRPTNTSENMIIAYKDIYLSPRHEYSTDEQVVGKWYDGRNIYEKVVECGALPNTASKSIPTGISNLDKVLGVVKGMAYYSTYSIPLPYADMPDSVTVYMNGSNVVIKTATDRSAYTQSHVVLHYLKTTD